MKTLSGKILSSTPISLSKASKILSKFVTADTAASQPVSAYLLRASAAFDELVQLHKELKPSRKPTKDEENGVESGKKHSKKRKMGESEENKNNKKKRRIELEQ